MKLKRRKKMRKQKAAKKIANLVLNSWRQQGLSEIDQDTKIRIIIREKQKNWRKRAERRTIAKSQGSYLGRTQPSGDE